MAHFFSIWNLCRWPDPALPTLLSSVCCLVSWQIQTGKPRARSLQMFVSCCWFIFRMYHLPVTVAWSMTSWGRENIQHREKGFFYFFHPLLNILIPIVVYDQKYGTRRGIFYAVSAIAYIPFISINSFREFLGSFSGFSLGHRSTHCSFMHCGLQLYPAGMLYSWSNI